MPLKVKPGVVKKIERQVKKRLDECAKATTLDPEPNPDPGQDKPHCPFRAEEDHTGVEDVRWSITAYPKLKLG